MTTLRASRSGSSMISHDDKLHILSKLPADAKALVASSARIYHASFANPDVWSYTGLQGFLVFGRNTLAVHGNSTSAEPTYWFRLIDSTADKGVIWAHQVAAGLEYYVDKPFFHLFSGKSRMFGFRFDEDLEADRFYKKVISKVGTPAPPRKDKKSSSPKSSSASLHSLTRRHVTTHMISTPNPYSFVHRAHIGYSEEGRLEVENVDAEWVLMLEELKGHGIDLNELEDRGVDRHTLVKDQDFVKGFLAGVKAIHTQEDDDRTYSREINVDRRRKSMFRRSRHYV